MFFFPEHKLSETFGGGVLQTVILADATEVHSFGIMSALLFGGFHLKITNKRVLSSHRVIVAELHENGCSAGCFCVLSPADLVPFLLISVSLTAQQHDMKGQKCFLEERVSV